MSIERRKITISGSMYILDHDSWSGIEDGVFSFSNTVYVDSNAAQELMVRQGCVDEEVRGELHLNVQLVDEGGSRVTGSLKLYEGASCTTNDLDGEANISFTVPRDATKPYQTRVTNTAEGGDYIDLTMNVSNADAA